MGGTQKAICITAAIVMGGVSDLVITVGTAYLVFWHDVSGWWWILACLLGCGITEATYKIINGVMTQQPIPKLGDLTRPTA